MRFSSIEKTGKGCVTRFKTGEVCASWPYLDQPHYRVISHRCGYGDDLATYHFEHEFTHLFLCEKLYGRACPILLAEARGEQVSGADAAFEEISVQQFQRWVRANERPIVGDVDWDGLKREAIKALS